jgi:hypothetical protein
MNKSIWIDGKLLKDICHFFFFFFFFGAQQRSIICELVHACEYKDGQRFLLNGLEEFLQSNILN